MKKLITIGLILLLTTIAYSQLTTKEEEDIKELLANKQALLDIVNTINLEKIPLQIAQLREQRQDLIAARDAEIKAEQVNSQAKQEVIRTSYAVQIGDVDALISGLQAQLNP